MSPTFGAFLSIAALVAAPPPPDVDVDDAADADADDDDVAFNLLPSVIIGVVSVPSILSDVVRAVIVGSRHIAAFSSSSELHSPSYSIQPPARRRALG